MNLHEQWASWRPIAGALAAGLALGLSACGGGAGAAVGAGAATAGLQLRGVAVDGYLHGATVFLDLDRDGVPDEGEPRTQTDAQGAYVLDVTALGSAAAGHPIVVIGGVDTDTGNAFEGRLVVQADLASTGQVVTPLTTLADGLVSAGHAADPAEARAMVAAALGLDETDLARDPVALLASRPGVYTAQVALQRAIDVLVQAQSTANAQGGNASGHEAHRQAVRALADVVAQQVSVDIAAPAISRSSTRWRRNRAPVSVATLAARVPQPGAATAGRLAGALEAGVGQAARERDPVAVRATLQAVDDVRKRLKALDKHGADDVTSVARLADGTAAGAAAGPVERLIRDHDGTAVAELKTRRGPAPAPVTAVQPANTRGRLLASNCFQCHGTGGVGGFDRIRGSEVAEVVEYLGRPARSDIMAAHAQGYTRQQLADIVTYLRQ